MGIVGGIGLYLTPVIKIQGGAGAITATDNDGKEVAVGTAVEYGIGYDMAWGSNKIVLSWKFVEVSAGEEEVTAAELQGNPSHASVGIALSIPFMR